MKLEDIPKKHNFKIPDGYFDALPLRIQSRISGGRPVESSPFFRFRLQYVLPVILISVGLFWLLPSQEAADAESILASVETADMVAYLTDSELTTEEVLDEVDFYANDVEDIEMEIYQLQLEDGIFDQLIDETDVENM